jgi:hypothetical protein
VRRRAVTLIYKVWSVFTWRYMFYSFFGSITIKYASKYAALQQKGRMKVLALRCCFGLRAAQKWRVILIDSFSTPMVSCNAPKNVAIFSVYKMRFSPLYSGAKK